MRVIHSTLSVFGVVYPITFVNPHLQRCTLFLNLVAIFWESASIDVIDLCDGGKGDELDDDIDSCVNGSQVDDAGHLGGETTNSLHEGDEEGTPWI